MVLTPRFAASQISAKGGQKIRVIDDFRASRVNDTVGNDGCIIHDHVGDLLSVAKEINRQGATPLS